MPKRMIMIVVAVVLVIATATGLLLLRGDNEEGSNTQNATSEPDTENALSIDTAALEGAYRLTLESNDGGQTTGTFEFDGSGNVSAVVVADGETTGYRVVDDITYIQNPEDQTWTGFPASAEQVPTFDINQFALSNEDIDEIDEEFSITEVGEGPCAAGTCRIYQQEVQEDGEYSTIRIDTETDRISEVEVINEESNTRTLITYTYPNDIEIVAPEDATVIDTSELLQ